MGRFDRTGGKHDPRPILGCQFVYVRFGYPMDLCHAVGDAREIYRRKAWPSWFVRSGSAGECSGGLRWDERLGTGVVAVSPVVTSVVGRNNCGCLDDLFYLCTGVADALGNRVA
jgi:hypothetical protein